MIKRYFSHYKSFKCIADKCPATCCSGWAIEIDSASLTAYSTFCDTAKSKDEARDFSDRIDWKEEVFQQKANGDCAFLRPDGLCHMQATYGEAFLCQTCNLYPRHMEEFPDVREYSLAASCPVAAKMLLEETGPLTYEEETIHRQSTEIDDQPEEYEDFDKELYGLLVTCRTNIFHLLSNKELSFGRRGAKVLRYMKKVQDQMDEGIYQTDITEVYNLSDETDILSTNKAISKPKMEYASTPIPNPYCSGVLFSAYQAAELLDLFIQLEPLRPAFRDFLLDAQVCLDIPFEELLSLERTFRAMHGNDRVDKMLENISTYFTFGYLCGAVYDEYVFAMAAQAIYNSYMVLLLWMAKWKMEKDCRASLSIQELSEILYCYSRELEHSNENMILLEELLDTLSIL